MFVRILIFRQQIYINTANINYPQRAFNVFYGERSNEN